MLNTKSVYKIGGMIMTNTIEKLISKVFFLSEINKYFFSGNGAAIKI